jgi:hypothetical protein
LGFILSTKKKKFKNQPTNQKALAALIRCGPSPCVVSTVLIESMHIPGQGPSTFFSFWIFELQTYINHINEEAHASVHFSTQNSLQKEKVDQLTVGDLSLKTGS